MARYLLEDPVLARPAARDLERVMEPALRAIVDPEGEDACASRRSA
jgi:hypothetical protein